MRFVHYSQENKVLNKENFVNVEIEQLLNGTNETHWLNPSKGVMYLSLENLDGNSDWYNMCVKDESTDWINKTKSVFDINLNCDKILIFDKFSDLKVLFENYMNYKLEQRIFYDGDYVKEKIEKINYEISICDKYFSNLSKQKKEFVSELELLNQVIEELEKNKYPMPKIIDGDFNMQKKRNTNEYIANICRLKSKLVKDKNIYEDLFENPQQLIPHSINYAKIAEKYDGIYYTKNIIQEANQIIANSESYNSILCSTIYKFENTVSENIYSSHNVKNNHSVENVFAKYLKWLETDTLMIWNIDNVCLG